MKKLFIKMISLIMTAIIILSAFAGCDKSEANSKIMYSNLASQQVLNKLTEMMTYADISDNRQNILLEHIKQFNSIVSPDSLAAEFEEYNPEKAKYNPYDLQDEWNEKSPDFMGYNCRITAFSLFREFLEFSVDSEIRDEMIVLDSFDMDAIKTKEMATVLGAVKAAKKTLIVLPEKNDVVYKSARNIEGVKVTLVNTLNVYDILNCDSMVVVKDAVAKIEEVYA